VPLFVSAGATFDSTQLYRYVLWRNFVAEPTAPCLWVLLNPSTATEFQDDPTVRRCQEFSRRWGHDGCRVVNIFAWRSTDPTVLRKLHDPIGPGNDEYITTEATRSRRIVCAWGRGHWRFVRERARIVREILSRYECWCFGKTQFGEPIHPLYQARSAVLHRYP